MLLKEEIVSEKFKCKKIFKYYFNYEYRCNYVYVTHVWMPLGLQVFDPLGLDLQVIVSLPKWLMRTG